MDTVEETDLLYKISYIDSGFCRIVYEPLKSGGFVCIQDEGKGVVRCMALTDEDEPCYEITLKADAYAKFEIPIGDSELCIAVRKFLEDGIAANKGA